VRPTPNELGGRPSASGWTPEQNNLTHRHRASSPASTSTPAWPSLLTPTPPPLGEPAARPSSPPVGAHPSAAPPAFAPCISARMPTRRTQACVGSRRLNLAYQLSLTVFSVLLLLAQSSCRAGCLAPPPRTTPDPRRATPLCVYCAAPCA
jgi:hypothetical protein